MSNSSFFFIKDIIYIFSSFLGLVGFGEIAQKTANLAKSFNMEIIAFDPFLDKKSSAWDNVKNVSLEKLLRDG